MCVMYYMYYYSHISRYERVRILLPCSFFSLLFFNINMYKCTCQPDITQVYPCFLDILTEYLVDAPVSSSSPSSSYSSSSACSCCFYITAYYKESSAHQPTDLVHCEMYIYKKNLMRE